MGWARDYAALAGWEARIKTAGVIDSTSKVITGIAKNPIVETLNHPAVWLGGMGLGMAAGAYDAHKQKKLVHEYQTQQNKLAGSPKIGAFDWNSAGLVGMGGLTAFGAVDTAKTLLKTDKKRRKELGIPEPGKMAGHIAIPGRPLQLPGGNSTRNPSMPRQAEPTGSAPTEMPQRAAIKAGGTIRLVRNRVDDIVDSLPIAAESRDRAKIIGNTIWLGGGLGTVAAAGSELAKAPGAEAAAEATHARILDQMSKAPIEEAAAEGLAANSPPPFMPKIADFQAHRKMIQNLSDLTWAGAGIGTLGLVGYNVSQAAKDAKRKREIQDAALARLQTAPILSSDELLKSSEVSVVDDLGDGQFKVKMKSPANPLLSARPFVGEEISPAFKLSFRIETWT